MNEPVLFELADRGLRMQGYRPARIVLASRSEGFPEDLSSFGNAAVEYRHESGGHAYYVIVSEGGQDSMRVSGSRHQHCVILDADDIARAAEKENARGRDNARVAVPARP